MKNEEIQKLFAVHPPINDQPARYLALAGAAQTYAQTIQDGTPESKEKALALVAIQEAYMWANAAIANNEFDNHANIMKKQADIRAAANAPLNPPAPPFVPLVHKPETWQKLGNPDRIVMTEADEVKAKADGYTKQP